MFPLCAHGTQGCGLPLSLGATSCGALPRRCAVVPLWESIRDPWGTDKSVLGSGGGRGRDAVWGAVRGAVFRCRSGVPFWGAVLHRGSGFGSDSYEFRTSKWMPRLARVSVGPPQAPPFKCENIYPAAGARGARRRVQFQAVPRGPLLHKIQSSK